MTFYYTSIMYLFLYLSCFSALTCHASQEKSLHRLHKFKLDPDAVIDRKLYQQVPIIDETRVLSQQGLKEQDRIDKLPGQPHVKFTQYSGYVTVDENKGRALFYYFVEAQASKDSKPLLLWLNGGPGCSSLAFGAMQELGPFRVNSDGKTLYRNPHSWNKVANVLFLESPAGVGFSYSNTSWDYNLSGDKVTADDNYVFLVNWLERFPEYKNREFYISGESYAGHYVPQFAHTILLHNENGKYIINLKGIIIGNALIHDPTDFLGMYDYLWTHAIISDEVIENIHHYCDFSPNATSQPKECNKALNESDSNIHAIDIFNIYAADCLNSNLTEKPRKHSLIVDPCNDFYVHAYLNTPDVQNALHANVTNLNYTWEGCSIKIHTWGDSPFTMLPLLQEFMAKGLRVWLYSGDTDARVPVTSTKYSLNSLNLPVKTTYYPWYQKQEVGGYSVVYKGDLTFATVRGAGHEVPSFQPLRALSLIKHFLDGIPLPKQ